MSNTVGCIISIVGNVIVSLSLNVQRLAHKKLGLDSDEEDDSAIDSESHHSEHKGGNRNYLTSPWWWAGIVLMAVGETGNFLAYAFAPASVVATLGTTGLIANVFFAPLILKETFRKMDLLGVAIAIAGGVTVVLSAQANQPQLSPEEILDAVSQTSFRIYLTIVLSLIVILLFLSPKYGHRYILVDLGLVALFGGFTALSTKGVSSLLTKLSYNCAKYPIFWVLLSILITSAILQIRYLNQSLANFDSTRVIPCQFCTFTISTIVGSAVLYRDFERMEASTIAQFICGCLLTFLGVWITSGRSSDASQEHDNTSMPSAVARVRNTVSIVIDEASPLMHDALDMARPVSRRLHSANAQTGPLLNYFIAKAESNRRRGSMQDSAYSCSPRKSSLRARPVDTTDSAISV